jgi:hypothetical protein
VPRRSVSLQTSRHALDDVPSLETAWESCRREVATLDSGILPTCSEAAKENCRRCLIGRARGAPLGRRTEYE